MNSPEEKRIRDWLNETRDSIPDDPEARTRRLLDNWTRGSNRKVSVELKEAAAREFGLTGVVYSKRPTRLIGANVRRSQADVRRIYRETQASLAARNVREVVVYRGVKTSVTTPGAVESWSTNRAIAQNFDGHDVMRQVVPAERILFMDGHSNFQRGPFGAQFEVGLLSDAPGT